MKSVGTENQWSFLPGHPQYTATTTTTTTTTTTSPSVHRQIQAMALSRSEIDQRFNLIGNSHTLQFTEALFVGVREKLGGAFPGYIAQKKHKETDPNPNPETGEHIDPKKQWMVKPGLPHDIFDPQNVTLPGSLKNRKAKMGAIQECLAAVLYAYLSHQHYVVPKTKLAELTWINSFTENNKILTGAIRRINEKRPEPLTQGIHILSKMVVGYQDMNQAKVVCDDGQVMDFMPYVKNTRAVPGTIWVELDGKTESLPLVGFIEILAVGKLMHDIDVLGGGGNNIGFVVEETTSGKVARAVKIDSGLAFYTFFGEGDKSLNDDVINLFLKSIDLSTTENFSLTEYHTELREFLDSIKSKNIRNTYEKQLLTDLKDIQTDSWCNTICWEALTAEQQYTFLMTLSQTMAQLQDKESIKYLLWRDNLLEDTFGTSIKPVDVDILLGILEQNCQHQAAVYQSAFETHNITRQAALSLLEPKTILEVLQDGLARHAENHGYIRRLFTATAAHDSCLRISESYVNLAIISKPTADKKAHTDEASQGKDRDDKADDLSVAFQEERQQFYQSLQQPKAPVKLDTLFDDPQHRRQLIIGAAGVGKTTLCQHLFYRTTQGLWSEQFKAVFWIPLRQLKEKQLLDEDQLLASDDQLLARVVQKGSLSGHTKKTIAINQLHAFLTEHLDQTLWILDGYDEVIVEANQTGTVVHALLQKLNHAGPAMLITSRPQTQYQINQTPLLFDRVLENIGFTDENVEKYLSRFLSTEGAEAEKQQKAKQCLSVLKPNPTLWHAIHVPIVLDIIASMWGEISVAELHQIHALPMLYDKMVERVWLRYLVKTHTNTRVTLHDVPAKTAHLHQALSTLAAMGFEHQEIILTQKTLQQVFAQSQANNFREWLDTLVSTGFLTIANSQASDIQVCFIHLSFQEYFAGEYYAKQLISPTTATNVTELLQQTQYHPSYRLMWQFAFAKCYGHYKATQDAQALQSFWQIVLEAMDLYAQDHYSLVMDLLESCAVDRRIDIHETQFQAVYAILFAKEFNRLLRTRPNLLKACLSSIPGELSKGQLEELVGYFFGRGLLDSSTFKCELPSDSAIIKRTLSSLTQYDQGKRDTEKIELSLRLLSAIVPPGEKRVIAAVLQSLGDKHLDVREAAYKALKALATRGDPDVINVLIQKLKYPYRNVRYAACEALTTLARPGDPDVVNALMQRLADEYSDVRKAACEALTTLATPGDLDVVNALMQRLEDKDWHVIEATRKALKVIVTPSNPNVVKALIQRLGDEDWHVREAACKALTTLATPGDPGVVKVLMQRLADKDIWVRKAAWEALTTLATPGDLDVINALMQRLADKGCDVREAACKALTTLATPGDLDVINALMQRLADEHSWVSNAACWALKTLATPSDPDVIKALMQRLANQEWDVRQAACWALTTLATPGDPDVINALMKKLGDEHWHVREAACKALTTLATPGDPDVINALMKKLTDKDENVRQDACEALTALAMPGDAKVINALMQRLKDPYSNVIQGACRALTTLATPGDPDVVNALMQRLADNTKSQSNEVMFNQSNEIILKFKTGSWYYKDGDYRRGAYQALTTLATPGDPDVINALMQRLADEDHSVREAACKALTTLATPGDLGVINALMQMPEDWDENIREAACKALTTLATPGDPGVINALMQRLADKYCINVRQAAYFLLKALATLKEIIKQSEEYQLFLLQEGIVNAVLYKDRIELDLNKSKERMIYTTTHPDYPHWKALLTRIANQKNIPVVKAFFLKHNLHVVLPQQAHDTAGHQEDQGGGCMIS